MKIDKKEILELMESSKLMVGVNHGFHDSILPTTAIKSYSKLEDLKPELRNDDRAISQDLALRLGTQVASKATLGAAALATIDQIPDYGNDELHGLDAVKDPYKIIPTIGIAWAGSNYANKFLPNIHKGIFGEKSIYK